MHSTENILFTPFQLGPIALRNRTIRAAAFEGMCPGKCRLNFAYYIEDKLTKFFIRLFGNFLVKEVPFTEGYFLEDALKFRAQLKLPLVYVGGLISREKIDEVLNNGFEMVAFARALIKDPDFINKLKKKELSRSECDICNYCIAVMYSQMATCIQKEEKPDPKIRRMLR